MISKRQLRIDTLTLVACLPIAAAILLWLFSLTGSDPIPTQSYRVHAVVPTSDALSPPAEVRIDGVVVGTVADIAARGEDGRRSLLLLELESEHAPVFRDGRVRIRLRTLVGENYVEIDPGTPSAGPLPEGGTLGVAQAEEYVASDDVFSAFDARHRRHLSGQIRSLGEAFENHGPDANRMLEAGSSFTGDASPVVARLSEQRVQVAALVDHLGAVMRTLGERRGAIRLLARRSETALGAFEARDEYLKQSLAELPDTLGQARSTATALADFGEASVPVLRNLRIAVERLQPLMRGLRPAAAAARDAMSALGPFAQRGARTLATLEPFARAGAETMPALGELLRHYNPFAALFARHRAETGAFFSNMGSVTNAVDATGHVARINAMMSPSSAAAFTPEIAETYERLRAIGTLEESVGPHYVNPHPEPGAIADPGRFDGAYPRVRPEPRAKRPGE